jgi:MFS family permease
MPSKNPIKKIVTFSPLFPLGFAVALSLLGDLSLFATLTTQLGALDLTLAQAGLLLSVHRLVRIPGNPLAGSLMDHFGRRPLFLVGMLLAVASTASYGLVHGFWPLLLGRVGWGLAWTLINVGGLNVLLDLSTPANRGRLAGTYNAWVWVGYALAPLLGGFLVDRVTFRPAMLILAGITALGLAAAGLLLPETLTCAGRATSPSGIFTRLSLLWQAARRLVLHYPRVRRGMLLFALVQFAGDGIVLSSLALLVTQRMGETTPIGPAVIGAASLSGGLLALRSILAGFSGPLAGQLSDRRFSRTTVIAAGLALGAVAFVILALSGALPILLSGVLLGAVAAGMLATMLPAYLGDVAPVDQRGAALGVYATFGDAGSMLGPFLALALVPLLGLAPIYLFAAAIFIAGIFLIRNE